MSTVTRPERARLLAAVLEELVEKGYSEVDVGAAARRANLAGEGWQSRFPDKDTCLLEAFGELTERLNRAIGKGCATAVEWPERVTAGLEALLRELSSGAEIAEALAQTLPSIGPPAQVRYQRFIEGLAPLLSEGRGYSELGDALPSEVEMLAVGAGEALVFEQIQLRKTARLGEMTPEILFSVLVPFLGAKRAAEEMERARARSESSQP